MSPPRIHPYTKSLCRGGTTSRPLRLRAPKERGSDDGESNSAATGLRGGASGNTAGRSDERDTAGGRPRRGGCANSTGRLKSRRRVLFLSIIIVSSLKVINSTRLQRLQNFLVGKCNSAGRHTKHCKQPSSLFIPHPA
ncbi:uncharacterized protein LOC114460624 isoform X2 [Gouania willdenowi]|uniref:uncharacterized protein LOC114460624 isoform X2 n=1 Tax=Gouania willdenowi TaxID=441366 RepID=UPI001054BE39|nr:uncharacterized protein LOC114460624 isoform X2 [Gouania willdenowi]